jgi:hypothetical protein
MQVKVFWRSGNGIPTGLLEAIGGLYRVISFHVKRLNILVSQLAQIRNEVSSTKALLKQYYSSSTVVRVLTKARYMQIKAQLSCTISSGQVRRVIASQEVSLNAARFKEAILFWPVIISYLAGTNHSTLSSRD